MRHMNDPRQNALFDEFAVVFSDLGRKTVEQGWQAVFRHAMLELMPARELGEHFSPDMGQPTKELYSMAGLLFIAEFHGWSAEEAAQNYMFRNDVHFALNLPPANQSLSSRTVERYLKLFRDDKLAAAVFERVTAKAIALAEIDVRKQRLDSTHVLSNMAVFGRTRQMAVAIRRFLVQVKRHRSEAAAALPEDWRRRYAPSEHQLLADVKDAAGRERSRQQVAQDLHDLVERFADDAALRSRSSYQALVRMLAEQCDVVAGKVIVKASPGGDCLQNPSDPDATYDGHKGAGYKVQLAETCGDDNEVQLITAVLPQTACQPDAAAVEPVLERLENAGRLPEEMLVDAGFASEENVALADAKGIELVGPTPGSGQVVHQLCLDDFAVDERTGTVERCPAGHAPTRCVHDAAKGLTIVDMPAAACSACPFRDECPIQTAPSGRYYLRYRETQRRSEGRRREEDTPAFQQRYSKRSGIESTNSGVKRRTAMKRLRVRGQPSVFQAIYLKTAGWNLLQAARSRSLLAWLAQTIAARRLAARFHWLLSSHRPHWALKKLGHGPIAPWRQKTDAPTHRLQILVAA